MGKRIDCMFRGVSRMIGHKIKFGYREIGRYESAE